MLALQLSLTNCIHMCARDSNIAIDAILEVLPQQYKDLDTEDQDQDRKDLYDRGRTGMGRQGHAALSMILLSYYRYDTASSSPSPVLSLSLSLSLLGGQSSSFFHA
jgi:hypothetical protein